MPSTTAKRITTATDTADLQAQAQSELGFSRETTVLRTKVKPHPGRGGSDGYEVWFRMDQIARNRAGLPITASISSINRWKKRLMPYRKTGNRSRRKLVGTDLLNLVFFLIAHPDALLEEMAIFLYNEGAAEVYSTRLISKRLKELGVSKKKASIEAFQALRPDVLWKEHCFWNFGPPLGICGVRRRMLLDIDEFCMTLQKVNRKKGWALTCHRVRKHGHYKVGNSLTCLVGIEPGSELVPAGQRGSIENPRRWCKCIQNGGTTINIFRDFVDEICRDIEAAPIPVVDNHRIFLWDNLAAHHSAYVHQTVTGRGGNQQFSIVPRPPYMPKYGPIEYKICDITHDVMKRKLADWDVPTLEREVLRAVQTIGPFNSTFRHCGYKWIDDANANVIIDPLSV
jgi:hypothetical protein